MHRCSPVPWALVVVSAWASCVVVGADRPPRSQRPAIPPAPLAVTSPAVEEPGRIQQPAIPGFESGFTHCCGDFDHVMQVDCSERLLRCYENQQGSWRQTYGRVCRNNLEASCYERGCIYACD